MYYEWMVLILTTNPLLLYNLRNSRMSQELQGLDIYQCITFKVKSCFTIQKFCLLFLLVLFFSILRFFPLRLFAFLFRERLAPVFFGGCLEGRGIVGQRGLQSAANSWTFTCKHLNSCLAEMNLHDKSIPVSHLHDSGSLASHRVMGSVQSGCAAG